jgi:CCR4-NOT complex subunit CAF16
MLRTPSKQPCAGVQACRGTVGRDWLNTSKCRPFQSSVSNRTIISGGEYRVWYEMMLARGRKAIVVRNLNFSYTPHTADSEVLLGVNFKVPLGARVVLVGLNGAGKSTLLSILSGSRMAPDGAVTVLGEDAFRGQAAKRKLVYICSEWTAAVAGMSSMGAQDLMASAVERVCEEEREETAARGQRLAELLGVDSQWQVYALSEGQRRRLHLVIKLMPLWDIALLDEATTDLDIVARRNLLLFLRHDSAARHATVVYCTHIFDGLEGWASHIALIQGKRVARLENCLSIPALSDSRSASAALPSKHPEPASSLYQVVSAWLNQGSGHKHTPELTGLAPHPRALPGQGSVSVAVESLCWGWGPGAKVGALGGLVLRDLSCTVRAGRRVVLAGANGAGKTSLLHILAGLRLFTPADAVRVLGFRAFEDFRNLNRHVVLLRFGVQGAGCGVWGVGAVGCGLWGVGCGVWGVGCGVWGLGFRV